MTDSETRESLGGWTARRRRGGAALLAAPLLALLLTACPSGGAPPDDEDDDGEAVTGSITVTLVGLRGTNQSGDQEAAVHGTPITAEAAIEIEGAGGP